MTLLNFTFQESSPLITYSAGGWVEGSSSNDTFSANYSGESFRVSFTGGATASFSFAGTAVSLFGARRPNHGNYTVQMDQQPLFTSDGNSDNAFNMSLWHASDLEYSRHTVTFTNTPTPAGMFVDLDYVSIERQIGQDGDTIFNATLDDMSPTVQFTGPWETSVGVSSAFQGTIHTTKIANSTAVVQFRGCCIELYGQYANAPYSVTLDDQSPIMMQGLDVDLPENFQHPQTLLYLIDGLSERSHNVTLTNLNSNVNRPFMFDYAVISSTHEFNSTPNNSTPNNSTPNSDNGLSSSSPDSSPPVKAIVGGVIGGLFVLALIVTGILFGRRRRRRLAGSRFSLNLINEDPELKPYILPTHPELEDEPHGRHSSGGRALPPAPAGAVHALPPAKIRTQVSATSDFSRSSEIPSSDRLLSLQEQPEASGSSSHERVSTLSTTCATTSDSDTPPLRSGPLSRRAKNRFTLTQMAGENSRRRMVQEEDAGVVLDPDGDKAPTVRTLPPAYNPEWHREP